MENLTAPKAILFGLGLIALAIASVPYSSLLVKDAYASNIQKVQVCGYDLLNDGLSCLGVMANPNQRDRGFINTESAY